MNFPWLILLTCLCGEFRTLSFKLFDDFEISSWMVVILVELRTEWLLMNQLLPVIVLNVFILCWRPMLALHIEEWVGCRFYIYRFLLRSVVGFCC